MNIIFIHQNFPGQFRHIAAHFSRDVNHHVIAISQPHAPKISGIKTLQYEPARAPARDTHHYMKPTEAHILNGQAVEKILIALKEIDFHPDIVIAHSGWGEALFVKDIFPKTKLIGFFEFYYKASGADVGFDPEFPSTLNDISRVRVKNITHLLSLEAVDAGICPTEWQKSIHPKEFQHKLHLIHEGINTELAKPNIDAVCQLPNGQSLSASDEVITYVSRNLEPYRGFHTMMRAIELICQRRPKAQFLIMGGDRVSYGKQSGKNDTWRKRMLKEVTIDKDRVHFLGNQVTYKNYLKVLQISSAHIYLTVPFVLSWSMLEAMSSGCVVIGSNTTPVREVIEHEQNGLLVDFFSPSEIADAVDKVIDNPGEVQSLRKAARQTVLDRYTVDKGLKQYTRLIQTLMKS